MDDDSDPSGVGEVAHSCHFQPLPPTTAVEDEGGARLLQLQLQASVRLSLVEDVSDPQRCGSVSLAVPAICFAWIQSLV